jgi:HEAT repeat protein
MGLRRPRLARALATSAWALGLALALAPEGRADPRRTVCSVTLHSEDEIATLRAHLPEDEFRFVELTELAPEAPAGAGAHSGGEERSEDDWLGAACESGIRCDVLVVSGHFGGSFFGASGRTLGLADLEAHACRDDCAGVLRHPTEVFLLGCNTAASKARDHRSPDEYLRALREDGISRRSAERIVESRYGPLGNSFRARMERVFAGVPHLYGFGSVAPAGPTASIALEQYLGGIHSYGTHLDRMSSANEPAPNRALARALGHTTFVEFAGMSSDGEAAAHRELVCSLYDDTRTAEERLGVVEVMAADPAFLSYVPSIERFFDTHPRWSLQGPRAEASLGRLEAMAQPRGQLLERLDALGAPTLRGELAAVAASLGWIDEARHQRIARDAVVELLDRDMGPEEQNAICELAPRLGDTDLHEDELDPEIFDPAGARGSAARHAARALLCVEPREPALRGRMAAALDDESWGVRARALETLARLDVDDSGVWAAAARLLATDPRTEVRAEAARALAGRPIGGTALSGALGDPEATVRAAAARGLGGLGDHPGVAGRLARALADGDWQVQFAAASALDQIAQSPAGFGDPVIAAEVEDALEQALDAPSWFVRYKVAGTLARIRTAGADLAGREAGQSEG